MKSVGIYKENELIARYILDGEIKTVGNITCDIPIPEEERILFAIEMNKDEEIGHLYMYEELTIEINEKIINQSLVEIQMGDIIKLNTGIEIKLLMGEYVPEKKVSSRPPPIVIVPKEMVPIGIESIKEIEKPHINSTKVVPLITEEEELIDTETDTNTDIDTEETLEELPPLIKTKQASILDYLMKK